MLLQTLKKKLWPQPTFVKKGQVTGTRLPFSSGFSETPGWRSDKSAWGSRTSSLLDSSKYHPNPAMPEKTIWRGVMRDHPSQGINRNQERNLDSSPNLTEMRQQEKTNKIFQGLKEKNCQPRILHVEKISFRNEG